MNFVREPLVFEPVYKDYPWGGRRIAEAYGRQGAPEICAESWEIAARPDGDSIVKQGRFAGRGLAALADEFGANLTGTRAPDPHRFPLLFKLIDARECLSVQVHPDESGASLTGGEPKTELWVILDSLPDACLYAGLRDGCNPASLRQALAEGTAERLLPRLDAMPGHALFIPGGLIHAVGAGCLIYEIQQNSNTTYRLFDWNRAGFGGEKRALHMETGLRSVNWSLPAPKLTPPVFEHENNGNRWSAVSRCAFFSTRLLEAAVPERVKTDGSSFHAVFTAEGSVELSAGGHSVPLAKGSSALIPADAGEYTVTPQNPAKLLFTTL